MVKKLLIIEDNKSISSVIKHLGDSLGYQATIVDTFANVKLLLAEKHDFFVATVDINLPDAPNGEVIPYVLERNIPSIIMTGRMDEKTHRTILNLPIIDYLMKENAQTYHYLLRILSGQLTNHKTGILLVDASTSSRNQLEILLRRRNFTIYCANNAPDALVLLEQHSDIKVVITEQDMPVVSGIQLVQKIRKEYSVNQLIIIGISDNQQNFQAERFIKNGANDYLKRPFSSEEFYCRIMQNIERLDYIEEIENLANTNHSTGLYNRLYFIKQTTKRLKEKSKHPAVIALVFLHINNFRDINNEHGFKTGNALLIALAERLKDFFKSELMAHFREAEFAILIHADSLAHIESTLQLFHQKTIENAFVINEQVLNITINIGAQQAMQKATMHCLLEGADNALIEAGQQADNSVHIRSE